MKYSSRDQITETGLIKESCIELCEAMDIKFLLVLAGVVSLVQANCNTELVLCLNPYYSSTGTIVSVRTFYNCLSNVMTCDPGSKEEENRLHYMRLALDEIYNLTGGSGESPASAPIISILLLLSGTCLAVMATRLRWL
ncbi:hypothetical protein Btru_043636 [Bulinus truncatus]|nr:hypothetical protein Btru_043636 [Bulinus truncatus]